jgi:hypothetical protein
MDQAQLMKLAIPAAMLFVAWKYGGTAVKTGALGIAAVVVAKQVPYLNQVI